MAAALPVLLLIAAIATDAPAAVSCTTTPQYTEVRASADMAIQADASGEVRVAHANLYVGMTPVAVRQRPHPSPRRPPRRRHPQRDLQPHPRAADPTRLPGLESRDTPRRPGDPRPVAHRHLAPHRQRHRAPPPPAREVGDPLPQLGHPRGHATAGVCPSSPPTPHRAAPAEPGLLTTFVERLIDVVRSLRVNGPVVVGADLNTQYPHRSSGRGWLTTRLTSAGITTTFDALGEPQGGWATGDGGGTIDYLLTSGATPLTHATRDLTSPTTGSSPPRSHSSKTGCPPADGAGLPPTCPASGGPAEAGLTADALRVMRCVLTVFGPHPVGGVGSRPNASDHPAGRAVDVMIPRWNTPSGKAEGWRIARWAQANAAALRITYVIFDARIWSTARAGEGWRHYSHPTGASNPTLDHLDHVHISVIGD